MRRRNRAFWSLARRMLEHRLLLGGVLVAAFVSASGLGVGLLAMVPVLKLLLDDGASLAAVLADETQRRGVTLPTWLLDALPGEAFSSIVFMMVGIVLLTLFGAAANYVHRYLSLTLTAVTIAEIRSDVFARTIRQPLWKMHDGVSEAQSRLLNDTDMLRYGFAELTSKLVAHLFKGFFAFAAALIIDWRITLWALLVVPPLAIMLRKLGKRVRRASERLMQARAGLLGLAGETFAGLRAIKSCNAEAQRGEVFDAINDQALRQEMKARSALALSSPMTEAMMVIVLAVLATLAARQILLGQLDAGSFFLSLAALATAGGSLKPVSSLVQSLQVSDAAAKRILELSDSAGEEQNEDGPILGLPSESISFEDVTFAYQGASAPAVDGVSLEIPTGTTVAFVGPNGSGKTTLLSLLPRFFEPDAGRITIDGVDIAGMRLSSLRGQIGVVPQDVMLFSGSIRENIALGLPDATDAQVERALQAAHAEDLVKLKGGLDAQVGEGGVTLSGGQRQRLCIARALLREPSILILDEATSMIDADSEKRIAEAVREFAVERTCLVIAHRLSTVQHADRIVVLDGGRVIDTGTHNELLAKSEVYQRLVAGQLVSVLS